MRSAALALPARHAAADHAAQAHLGIAAIPAVAAVVGVAAIARVAGPVAGSVGVGKVALAAGTEEVQVLGSIPSDA